MHRPPITIMTMRSSALPFLVRNPCTIKKETSKDKLKDSDNVEKQVASKDKRKSVGKEDE